MNSLYILSISICWCLQTTAQNSSITDVKGNHVNLDSLSGKKTLVLLLPLQRDTSIVAQLLRFQNRHGSQVKVIGLICQGLGYPSVDSIRAMYDPIIDAGVILTTGIQPGDSTRNQRETVLQWLSEKNRNRQVEQAAVNRKYFLSEGGRLFAQTGIGNTLDSRVIDNIVKTRVPGEVINQ